MRLACVHHNRVHDLAGSRVMSRLDQMSQQSDKVSIRRLNSQTQSQSDASMVRFVMCPRLERDSMH